MDFGYVLRRAWEIIWKFKILWLFGILASCSQAGSSAGSNSGYRFSIEDTTVNIQAQQYFNQHPGLVTLLLIIGLIVVFILVVLAILLSTVGKVGLIRGTMKAEQGAGKLTFAELWHEGMAFFWRVFGLNLLIGLIVLVSLGVLLFLGVILSIGTVGIFLVCLIPLLCLMVPLMWLVGIIIEQANVALVVENLDILSALKRGWQVFVDNIGNMIVMGLILIIGVGLVGGFIIGLPLVAIAAPAAIAIDTGIFENIRSGIILSVLLFLIYLPFLLLFSGVLRSYIESAWTLTYLRLTTKPSPLPVETPLIPIPEQTPPLQTM